MSMSLRYFFAKHYVWWRTIRYKQNLADFPFEGCVFYSHWKNRNFAKKTVKNTYTYMVEAYLLGANSGLVAGSFIFAHISATTFMVPASTGLSEYRAHSCQVKQVIRSLQGIC